MLQLPDEHSCTRQLKSLWQHIVRGNEPLPGVSSTCAVVSSISSDRQNEELKGKMGEPRWIGQSPDPVQVGPDGPTLFGPPLVQLLAAPWPLRCSCWLLPSSGQRLDYLQGQGRLTLPPRDVSFEYILRGGARRYGPPGGMVVHARPGPLLEVFR